MKKISEMTLEELQDYALTLEAQNATERENNASLSAEVQELTGLNKTLQKRNNDLLMKVEQQPTPTPTDPPEKPAESCEDFAKRFVKGE